MSHFQFRNWRAPVFTVLLLGMQICVGVSASTEASAASSKRGFTFRLSGEPATLDWNKAHTPIETYLMVNLMEGLIGLDENVKPVPALAESWKVTDSGKTYTFKLRKGVQW